MECVEGALKSNSRPETTLKRTHQQVFLDNLWAANGQNGVSGEDFSVDDLLDLSKEGSIEDGFLEAEAAEKEDIKPCSVSVFPYKQREKHMDEFYPTRRNVSVTHDLGSVPRTELSVPADELADLEWVSHFVDDSFSECSLMYPAGKLTEKPAAYRSQSPEIPVPNKPCFTTPVQTKARSKRARTGGRVWSLGSPSWTESSSSASSSSSTSSSSNPWLIYANPRSKTAESLFGQPPTSKKRKRENSGGSPHHHQQHQARRCSHCLVQKTPQWRTGPLGAKTLCNACGVRYKSGRLLSEYRPACSPTFSSELHSNYHRKVLEMRRKKEGEQGGLAPSPPVQSF
ncbi:GATA transcription factor 5 [Actinidia eriantha]|uniref:GATA transcription factor 5 n=1 Tax=Actinidia eriantha TaxID=165200 RepID=UPI0025841805|nr:GATA transcription factor 5 [Actinidia eriantha]